MARKRMLSPEMFTSRTVTAWPIGTRWTFVGLICYLDNYGYGPDDASLVKAAVWPRDDKYTATKVAADLNLIAGSGALCRFVCCDLEWMHSPRFDNWQKLAHPGIRRHCPCPVHEPKIREGHAKDSRKLREGFSLIEKNIEEEGSADPNGVGRAAFLDLKEKLGRGA